MWFIHGREAQEGVGMVDGVMEVARKVARIFVVVGCMQHTGFGFFYRLYCKRRSFGWLRRLANTNADAHASSPPQPINKQPVFRFRASELWPTINKPIIYKNRYRVRSHIFRVADWRFLSDHRPANATAERNNNKMRNVEKNKWMTRLLRAISWKMERSTLWEWFSRIYSTWDFFCLLPLRSQTLFIPCNSIHFPRPFPFSLASQQMRRENGKIDTADDSQILRRKHVREPLQSTDASDEGSTGCNKK